LAFLENHINYLENQFLCFDCLFLLEAHGKIGYLVVGANNLEAKISWPISST